MFDLSSLNSSAKKKLVALKKLMASKKSDFKPELTEEQYKTYLAHLDIVYQQSMTDVENSMKELMGKMGLGGMI